MLLKIDGGQYSTFGWLVNINAGGSSCPLDFGTGLPEGGVGRQKRVYVEPIRFRLRVFHRI